MKNYLKVLVSLIFFLCLSCSKNNPIEPSDDISYSEMLDNVSFTPISGTPGTIIEISNLELPVDEDTVWSLEIGGNIVPLMRDSSTIIRTVIPLIFADSNDTWPMTSSEPVGVTLLRFNKKVDSLTKVITIDSLPHAEGVADSLIADIQSGAEAIRNIALTIGITDTIMLATFDAMDIILYTGENSLENLINGNSLLVPSDSMHKEIFSALLVSSGFSDYFSKWSDSLNTIASTAKSLKIQIVQAGITDEGLAARMQLHTLIADFGTMVIGNTALSWSEIAVYVGAAGIALPSLNFIEFIISYIVAELDFIINKLIVAAFPAEITQIDLDFIGDTINVGDTTQAVVYISAKNNPPNITPMDIVLQVVGGIAVADWIRNIGIPRRFFQQLRNFDQIIQDLTVWFLNVINGILSTNYNYPTQLDVNFPHMTWDSVRVNNPELIDLMIPDLSKMSYIIRSFNGKAKNSLGNIGLQIRTQPPGPNTWIHPVMQSLGYASGPFGNDLYISNVDTVTIVSELALQVDFANIITVNGANVLGVDAGYYDSNGNPSWSDGIQINLSVTNGSASTMSGVTDAQGHFNSIITIDSSADSVTVHVFAYGAYNAQEDTIVVAVSDALTSDTLGSGWGIRCVSDQGDNGSWIIAIGGYTFSDDNVTEAHDEFNLLYSNKDCGLDFSANPGKYMGAQTTWGTASLLSEAIGSVNPQSSNYDYFKGFSASGTCTASNEWSILDSSDILLSSSVRAFSDVGTYINLFVDSGYFVLVYEGEIYADNSYTPMNSETFFSINTYEVNYTLDASTNSLVFSDSLLLSPGNYYSIKVKTYAEGDRVDYSASGSSSGISSYTVNCRIHRAPMQ